MFGFAVMEWRIAFCVLREDLLLGALTYLQIGTEWRWRSRVAIPMFALLTVTVLGSRASLKGMMAPHAASKSSVRKSPIEFCACCRPQSVAANHEHAVSLRAQTVTANHEYAVSTCRSHVTIYYRCYLSIIFGVPYSIYISFLIIVYGIPYTEFETQPLSVHLTYSDVMRRGDAFYYACSIRTAMACNHKSRAQRLSHTRSPRPTLFSFRLLDMAARPTISAN